ncbi:MAG TPA: hypothetical protein VM869_08880 [Enhygromyxa sp.]|nr:hypothetical protein [Enhygromyxa sp.]
MILHLTLASSLLGAGPPAEPAPEPEPEPIAVPAPEQVRDAAESGAGPLPQPEQVRDEANLETAPSQPPDPQARPSEGVHAVGSSGIAPLPPPPPPVSPETISRGRWSGVGWLSVRLLVAGPIAGDSPARPTVIALGGGAEGGWRIRQWIGLGTSFTRQPHEVYREDVPDAPATITFRGYMSAWDIAFVRLFAPVRGRVDPFVDIGGGLAFFEPARDRPTSMGGSVRASVGFEAWIARNLTLGISGVYRANFVDDTVGHAWQGALDFGVHW